MKKCQVLTDLMKSFPFSIILLIIVGCASSHQTVTNSEYGIQKSYLPSEVGPPTNTPAIPDQFVAQFRANTTRLDFGLSSEDVKQLLGPPGQTQGLICGINTPSGRWNALEWIYAYDVSAGTPRYLHCIFQKINGQWYLNSWTYDP